MLRQNTWIFPNALEAEAARFHIDTEKGPGRAKWLASNKVELTGAGERLDAWIITHGGVKP